MQVAVRLTRIGQISFSGAGTPALPVLRSDIQPRMEACSECVSFPHTGWARRRFDDAKLMSANWCYLGYNSSPAPQTPCAPPGNQREVYQVGPKPQLRL